MQVPVGTAAIVAAMVFGSVASADEGAVGPRFGVITGAGMAGSSAHAPVVSEYWIGLECHPLGEVVREHLGLKQGEGLLVEQVVPKSPAAEAGIKRHDILLKAGKSRLTGVEPLVAAVERAKDSPLTLELLRGGKKQTVEVTPAKRPEQPMPDRWQVGPDGEQMKAFREWLESLQGNDRPPARFRFFHPGAILPPEADLAPVEPMPGDMSVVIKKQGPKPATVTVTRGEETWKVTEDSLDQLPDDVRPHGERLLGRVPAGSPGEGPKLEFAPDWQSRPVPGRPRMGPMQERLEKRLEEMNRRMDQLRKSIEGLRDEPAPAESSEEPKEM